MTSIENLRFVAYADIRFLPNDNGIFNAGISEQVVFVQFLKPYSNSSLLLLRQRNSEFALLLDDYFFDACPNAFMMEVDSKLIVEREIGRTSFDHPKALTTASPFGSRLFFLQSIVSSLAFLTASDTVRHVFAGTFARTMAQTVIHPIDTVKTRLQVKSPPKPVKIWKKQTKKKAIEVLYRGRRLVKFRNWLVKGPGDIYLGVTGSILGTLPVGLAYFAAYEACKEWLETNWSFMKDNPWAHFISTTCGAVTSCVVRVPTDTIRHRVQAYVHPNVFKSATSIVRTQGVLGLYAGFLPTVLRDVPELAVQFTLYERLRHAISDRRDNKKLRTWEHLLLGGFSGAVAAVVTMPLDVAKTTIQCGTRNCNGVEALKKAVEDKGVRALFAGMAPRVTQVALMSATFFTLFEFWKMTLKPASERDEDDSTLSPKIFNKERKKIWKRIQVPE